MKLKLIKTITDIPYNLDINENQIGKAFITENGIVRVYWFAECNAMGGVCDDCPKEKITNADYVEIYEEEK